VLQARLAHLSGAEQIVLQQASVLGRTFWDSIVAWINQSVGEEAGDEASELVEEPAEALAALQAREIVFQRESSSLVGAREYVFKHTMLREVAYRGVLERVPERYHGVVAEWLIEKSGERIGEVTGLIASHLELAGQVEQALAYLRQAGEQAAARYAHVEAAHYFSRALDLVPEADYTERYALLLAREKIYELLGEREAQAQDLAALEKLAETLDDEQRRAEVALRQARYIEGAGE
jgi:predicted ATPase